MSIVSDHGEFPRDRFCRDANRSVDELSGKAVRQAAGRTIVGFHEGGWPSILLDDGARLELIDAEGVVAPHVVFHSASERYEEHRRDDQVLRVTSIIAQVAGPGRLLPNEAVHAAEQVLRELGLLPR